MEQQQKSTDSSKFCPKVLANWFAHRHLTAQSRCEHVKVRGWGKFSLKRFQQIHRRGDIMKKNIMVLRFFQNALTVNLNLTLKTAVSSQTSVTLPGTSLGPVLHLPCSLLLLHMPHGSVNSSSEFFIFPHRTIIRCQDLSGYLAQHALEADENTII